MQNNDLSNSLTKRVLVSLDVIRDEQVTVKKVLKFIKVPEKSYVYNRQVLSRLYLYADRNSVSLELVSFDLDEEALKELVEAMDEMGTNPFRYFSVYQSSEHLVAELPFRPEVAGVIDIPTRFLRYGHWGLDF